MEQAQNDQWTWGDRKQADTFRNERLCGLPGLSRWIKADPGTAAGTVSELEDVTQNTAQTQRGGKLQEDGPITRDALQRVKADTPEGVTGIMQKGLFKTK